MLSIAGSLERVFLGFQSTNIFCLHLWSGWARLMKEKTRTRSTRHFTFNIELAKERKSEKANAKWSHHSLLEPVQTCQQRHMGFVHCMAQEPNSGVVASGGGDGRIFFWRHALAAASFNHGGAVLALAACAQGRAIFSGDALGRVRVWDCGSVQHGSKAVLCAGHVTEPIFKLN